MDFQKDVLDISNVRPVVVDFWAPWCGPCRYLGPTLDKLAGQQSNLWSLVKINVDEHPELSQQFGIMSIPAVKMFYKGDIVAEFTGALPLSDIEKWLEENLPSEDKAALAAILQSAGSIPDTAFMEALRPLVAEHPEHKQARTVLARHLVFTSPREAVALLEDIHMGDEHFDLADHIRKWAHFLQIELDEQGQIADLLRKAQEAAGQGNFEEAIQQIIEANRLDKNYLDDLPRLTAIAFFGIFGTKHELTKKYRRTFDMVLY